MLDIMTEEASSIASNSLRYVSTGRRARAEGRKQHAGESRVELTEAGGHTRAEQGGRRPAVCPDEMEQLKLGFGGEQLFLLSAPSRFCDNIKVKTECQSEGHQ